MGTTSTKLLNNNENLKDCRTKTKSLTVENLIRNQPDGLTLDC
jgi:hypothetical protein